MYERHFGFREMPFRVTPDPRFLFATATYEEAYSTLRYGVEGRKGFVLMTGEVGTGKTTLVRRLMEESGSDVAFVHVFNPSLDFDQLLSFIVHELGLTPKENDRLGKILALNGFLLWQLRHARTTTLLVDEAQRLSDETLEELRLLSNLEAAGEKLLQIILVGQVELEARLTDPKLRQLTQRIALRCRLERLPGREVGAFIRHRLRVAGTPNEDLFTADAIVRVARYSGGLPRLVNVICDNALLVAYGSRRESVTAEVVDEAASDLCLGRADGPGVAEPNLQAALLGVQKEAVAEPGKPSARLAPALAAALGAFVVIAVLASLGLGSWIPRPLAELAGRWLSDGPEAVLIGRDAVGVWRSPDPIVEREGDGPPPPDGTPSGPETTAPTLSPRKKTSKASHGGSVWNVAIALELPETAAAGKPPPAANGHDVARPARASSARVSAARAPIVGRPGREVAAAPERSSRAVARDERPRRGKTTPAAPLPTAAPEAPETLVPLLHSIEAGTTVYSIAGDAYGAHCHLALDLLHEANPQVPDLDLVYPRQTLQMPRLDRTSLLRRQPDGSWRLRLAAFPGRIKALRFARQVTSQLGRDARLQPRQVSGKVHLYRVDLPDIPIAEVDQTWARARALGLIPPYVDPFSQPLSDSRIRSACAGLARTRRHSARRRTCPRI